MPEIEPDFTLLASELEKAQREEAEREAKRSALMTEISRYRWEIARKHHLLENNEPLDFNKYPFQEDIYRDVALQMVVLGSTQWGKFQSIAAKIKTPSGWKMMGDLVIGDELVVPSGRARVTRLFPQGVQRLYRIGLEDGRTTRAGWDHLWQFYIDDDQKARIGETSDIVGFILDGHSAFIPTMDPSEGWKLKMLTSFEFDCEEESQCIMIDDPQHLYITDDYIVTHNTEFLICNAAAMAACGLRVFFVSDKLESRNKLVASRINPAFENIPIYRAMVESAKSQARTADSTGFKHFGPGSINFVGSNSESEFSRYPVDASIIDEHQHCILDNIGKIYNRMSGSPWRFEFIVGNPRELGTDENRNLDWEYKNTDQRQWQIQCSACKTWQILDWWQNFIREERNKAGAILNINRRDPDWKEGAVLDMRPMCSKCGRPMNRLAKGQWVARNPGHKRHGYQLSNLYNCNVRIDELYPRYIRGLHNPSAMGDFVNNQLGLAWSMEGSSITDRMLVQCSTGEMCGLKPYVFLQSSGFEIEEVRV